MLWDIGLDSWIIQDGNYGDFEVGRIAEFAVQFWQPPGTATATCDERTPRIIPAGETSYEVTGQLVFETDEITVLDLGHIQVFGNSSVFKVPGPDRWFKSRLQLAIDHFEYFERLCKLAGVPPLIYTWRIESILLQTAPFVDSRLEGGQTVRVRDLSKNAYREIVQTDAWKDDEGSAEYILRCGLVPVEPKYSSATAVMI